MRKWPPGLPVRVPNGMTFKPLAPVSGSVCAEPEPIGMLGSWNVPEGSSSQTELDGLWSFEAFKGAD
jgi:hypothetical protein